MRKPGWCSGPSYDPVTVVTRVQIPLRASFCCDQLPSDECNEERGTVATKRHSGDLNLRTSERSERSPPGSNPAPGVFYDDRPRPLGTAADGSGGSGFGAPVGRSGWIGILRSPVGIGTDLSRRSPELTRAVRTGSTPRRRCLRGRSSSRNRTVRCRTRGRHRRRHRRSSLLVPLSPR